jgi:parallel beta-helix repeat protein
VNFSFNVGWNFISIPVENSTNVNTLFPGNLGVMAWDGTSYVDVSSLEPGKGYWVLYSSDNIKEVCGEPVYEMCINITQPGWHAIGAPFNTTPTAPYEIFSYNRLTSTYDTSVSELEPTNGYWLLATSALREICFGGEIIIPPECEIDSCMEIDLPGEYRLCGNITSDRTDQCILISSDNVTLDCLDYKIDGDLTSTSIEYAGIKIDNKENITIKNCEIINFSKGISGLNLEQSKIENNKIHDCTNLGIFLQNPNYLTISNNKIYDIDDGETEPASYDNNEEGIRLFDIDNSQINHNIIYNCTGYGIYTKKNTIDFMFNNIFINNSVLFSYSGYRLEQQQNATFIDNLGNNNSNKGLVLWGVQNSLLENNQFQNNTYGIYDVGSCSYSNINDSTLCNNVILDLNITTGLSHLHLDNNKCDNSLPSDICNYTCGTRSKKTNINEISNDKLFSIKQQENSKKR